jgi:hypothetical protein
MLAFLVVKMGGDTILEMDVIKAVGPITLAKLLATIDTQPGHDAPDQIIYVEDKEDPISADTGCFVISVPADPSLTLDDIIGIGNLLALCDMDEARDIVDVARIEKPGATPEDLVNAFNYYLDNDAYLTFE